MAGRVVFGVAERVAGEPFDVEVEVRGRGDDVGEIHEDENGGVGGADDGNGCWCAAAGERGEEGAEGGGG